MPRPRAPMSRLPTALTSSMLPGLTLIISLPTSTTFSGSTLALPRLRLTGVGSSGARIVLILLLVFLVLLVARVIGGDAIGSGRAVFRSGGCAGSLGRQAGQGCRHLRAPCRVLACAEVGRGRRSGGRGSRLRSRLGRGGASDARRGRLRSVDCAPSAVARPTQCCHNARLKLLNAAVMTSPLDLTS